MQGKILTIKTNGELFITEVKDANVLPVLKDAVGGHIETVPYFDTFRFEDAIVKCVVFCNEEGKINELPVNIVATRFWQKSVGRPIDDVLVGDVAIVFGDEEFMSEL